MTLLVLGACSSSNAATAPTDTPALPTSTGIPTASTTAPAAPAQATTTNLLVGSYAEYPDGLRGERYCEVLLVAEREGRLEAAVWNTIGLNDCPQNEWEALDPAQIASDTGSVVAILNGPRYWTLDAIVSDIRDDAPATTFGSLEMFQAATVDLGTELPSQLPYVERAVARDTVFSFRAGSEVYELTDPSGQTYVMQSYSLQVDPTLTMDGLGSLSDRLALPEGWEFSSRVLDKGLDLLSTDGVATVVRDELQNTYQRIDGKAGG